MDIEQIISFLTSGDAYLVAAGFVFLAVMVLPRIALLQKYLDTPAKRQALALGLSVAPAIGAALVSHAPMARILAIAGTALMAGLAPDALPAGPPVGAKDSSGGQ